MRFGDRQTKTALTKQIPVSVLRQIPPPETWSMVGAARSLPCDVGRKERRRTCRRAVASLALAAVANSFSLAPSRKSAWSTRLVRPASAAQRRIRRQTLTAALPPVHHPTITLKIIPDSNEYLVIVSYQSSLLSTHAMMERWTNAGSMKALGVSLER